MLAESSVLYFIFSLGSLPYSDVYRRESGKCHTLPFFLTFFTILPFQVFLLYKNFYINNSSYYSDNWVKGFVGEKCISIILFHLFDLLMQIISCTT